VADFYGKDRLTLGLKPFSFVLSQLNGFNSFVGADVPCVGWANRLGIRSSQAEGLALHAKILIAGTVKMRTGPLSLIYNMSPQNAWKLSQRNARVVSALFIAGFLWLLVSIGLVVILIDEPAGFWKVSSVFCLALVIAWLGVFQFALVWHWTRAVVQEDVRLKPYFWTFWLLATAHGFTRFYESEFRWPWRRSNTGLSMMTFLGALPVGFERHVYIRFGSLIMRLLALLLALFLTLVLIAIFSLCAEAEHPLFPPCPALVFCSAFLCLVVAMPCNCCFALVRHSYAQASCG